MLIIESVFGSSFASEFFSHGSVGAPIPSVVIPLVSVCIMAASYRLRPQPRRLV